jgi:hypothetical protein
VISVPSVVHLFIGVHEGVDGECYRRRNHL